MASLRLTSPPDVVAEFHDLYTREYPKIAGYCFLLVRDREVAHDMAQEAFTRLFARWRSVREPRPFLFRVCTNLAHDLWRANTRERGLVEGLAGVPQVSPDRTGDVDLRAAVTALGAAHRDAVLLHYYADLSVADVAVAMRRPVGSIKRLLFEARAQLAIALEESHA